MQQRGSNEKLRLGLIGNGGMMRYEYLPYLEERIAKKKDIEIAWGSGCLCLEEERSRDNPCPMKKYRIENECELGKVDDWLRLLDKKPVDGIVVSLPNKLHGCPIKEALERGVGVAVDKPTTVGAKECADLVKIAEDSGNVFVTLSQRRYEDVYQTVAEIIRRGGLGDPLFIEYLITHEFFARNHRTWYASKEMAGGGALIASGYHGIDTVLWLLRQCPTVPVCAKSVSSCWRVDTGDDAIETLSVARISLSNGGVFNVIASFESPQGSLEENVKLFGTAGVIRIMRDRPRKLSHDQSAARLTYQQVRGSYAEYDTRDWGGQRWAPLADFIDALHAKLNGQTWAVLSPASESLKTIEIIEKAYQSAERHGQEIEIVNTLKVGAIHHVAVQTDDIEKALHFYTTVLGAELLRSSKFKKRDMAWLKVGDVNIELFSKRAGEELDPWSDFYSGPVHIAFVVENLDAFLDAALRRGAQFHPSHPEPFVPPAPGAQKIAYLLGPDGEEVEIRSRSDRS